STLEKFVGDDCIIASNTSSLSIASIASSLQKPERCIGIHFFNPAPLMKLVEVIPAVQTS
ncbi:MAG TPA: 3-hydroxybutyryl-CoA dehydrogenase, partial [Aequorivita sp.]|nr:3-hydroxybutyryl-CoA dehydrogenase [Aequorivita sp.]